MIKNMAMEFIYGLMEEYKLLFYSRNMRDIGIMENNQEKVGMYYKMAGVNWDFGKMEKELNGLINQNKMQILVLKIGIHMYNQLCFDDFKLIYYKIK